MDRTKKIRSTQPLRPNNPFSNLSFNHQNIFSKARQALKSCKNPTSNTTSKRSTATSKPVALEFDIQRQVKEQLKLDKNDAMRAYFNVFDKADPTKLEEQFMLRQFFPAASPNRFTNRSNFNLVENSTIEVVKIGTSVHMSRFGDFKYSQLYQSPIDSSRSFGPLTCLRQKQSFENRGQIDFLSSEIEDTIDKWRRERESISQKVKDLRSLVDTSTMGLRVKRTSLGKLKEIDKALMNHLEDLEKMREKVRSFCEKSD